MKAKLVYESLQFQRSSDPRQVLNIGQRAIIEEWFRDLEQQRGSKIDYTIDDKLNIIVKQGLWLHSLDIDWMPDNLRVGGYLDLGNTKITELPDNLRVEGDLYLNNTNITELPENLTVGGYLDLRYTKITELPDNLSVGGNIWISEDMKENLVTPKHLRNKIKIY